MNLEDNDVQGIIRLYNEGVSRADIADRLYICDTKVQIIIKELVDMGILEKRKEKRKQVYLGSGISKYNVKNRMTAENKRKMQENDWEGEGGVKCTKAIANQCLYGTLYPKKDKCDYALITGKCRTVQGKTSGFNPPTHCHCFQPATKAEKEKLDARRQSIPSFCINPREVREDEEYLLRMLEFDGLIPRDEEI